MMLQSFVRRCIMWFIQIPEHYFRYLVSFSLVMLGTQPTPQERRRNNASLNSIAYTSLTWSTVVP